MTRAALLAALLWLAVPRADAQAPPASPAPLERRVSVHLRGIALREALDRLALQTGIRLSYSGDHLPLDRSVTLVRDSAALGDVLRDLVGPFEVRVVAVASDHVVLAPVRPGTGDDRVQVLDRVVVTGSVIAASERPLPVAIDVVSGRDSERRDESSLSEVFSGSVPGIWLWEQTPTTMMARYGSIRGASSFGLTFPKMYIDGVEVANPLLMTHISPELVERVEVIRGPQGAALYGSDAISGVVNIVSRHEGAAPDGSHGLIRSSLGSSESRYGRYGTGNSTVQDHAVTMRVGSTLRAGGLTLGGSSAGEYMPRAYSREFRSLADTRLIGSRVSVTGHARFQAKDAGVPVNPLIAGEDAASGTDVPQSLRMYGAGGTVTVAPDARLTLNVTAGMDGYRLSNVSTEQGPVPSVADTALQAASGSATRGTFRAAAVTHAGATERLGATLTVAAEQSTLWDRTLGEADPADPATFAFERGTTTSRGILAQSTLTFRNTAYVTAGIRREIVSQTSARTQRELLPMAGLSIVRDFPLVSVKARAAYGKGIRAPRGSLHPAASEPRRIIENPALAAEEQAGTEAGLDLRVGRQLGLHVTRFDQLVTGLIQTVTISNPSGNPNSASRSSWYQLQNVGEISNQGWESQATLSLGSVQLSGAATVVDSRVRRVSTTYTGDLRVGDRMLAVPARTLSGTLAWSHGSWYLSSTMARASDWVNYDRLSIASQLVSGAIDAEDLTGAQLRAFWKTYPGSTRLRATASRGLWRGVMLTFTGENLLGHQRGEPDTITIVPGRTISVGLRARF